MKKSRCLCWSCVLGRAFHRARWLFTRAERKRISGALCYAIEQMSAWCSAVDEVRRGANAIKEKP